MDTRAKAGGGEKPSGVITALLSMTVDLHGGVSIPASLCILRRVEVAVRWQELTVVHAAVMVEAGKGQGGMVHVRVSGAAVLRDGHRRVTMSPASALAKWREH
jgi:hypothetical protein